MQQQHCSRQSPTTKQHTLICTSRAAAESVQKLFPASASRRPNRDPPATADDDRNDRRRPKSLFIRRLERARSGCLDYGYSAACIVGDCVSHTGRNQNRDCCCVSADRRIAGIGPGSGLCSVFGCWGRTKNIFSSVRPFGLAISSAR